MFSHIQIACSVHSIFQFLPSRRTRKFDGIPFKVKSWSMAGVVVGTHWCIGVAWADFNEQSRVQLGGLGRHFFAHEEVPAQFSYDVIAECH